MTHDDGEIASLRQALAAAERGRDAAISEAAAVHAGWQDERREMQHRFRNVCSIIRAIARRTGDDVETADEYCGMLDGRLSAYLNVQAAVMQDWSRGADLALLLAGALEAFGIKEGERVDLVGPPVRLTSQAAGILALALHELAYAAIMADGIEQPGNALRVTWRLDREGPGDNLLIDWIELPVAGGSDEWPSSWADWVEQAIRYQLAGTVTTHVDGDERRTRIRLPGSALC